MAKLVDCGALLGEPHSLLIIFHPPGPTVTNQEVNSIALPKILTKILPRILLNFW